jgi:hypothetical protein
MNHQVLNRPDVLTHPISSACLAATRSLEAEPLSTLEVSVRLSSGAAAPRTA